MTRVAISKVKAPAGQKACYEGYQNCQPGVDPFHDQDG
ncbi:hypothetical protein LBUL_1831 [Lactobacillus delbrueckii subsp. bulgaricus ATCC BAA-365]|nr:hypothetical protein LBUL_1831 [Lactobacillus delbrueckii subsp. bulgaricus ATCC BAA-365]